MTKLLPIFLLLATIAVPTHAASIYRWTDKTGQVHYTRTPPPKSMTNQKIESRNANQIPSERIEESPITKEPKKQPAKTVEMSSDAKKQQALCQSAKYTLNEMRRTDKVTENGHEIEITVEERENRMKALKQAVKAYCPKPQSKPQPMPQPVPTPAPKQ